MRNATLVIILLLLLAAAIVFAVVAWQVSGDSQISLIGWLAMIGGTVLTLLVGGGLMALVFYSARHGHDDEHHRGPPRE